MSTTEPGFTPVSTIPRWPSFVRPLLEVLSDGQTWRKRDMERAVAERAGITAEQLEETLDSGQGRAFNRIGWATSALRRAKAIEAPRRAQFRITDTGRQLLAENPGPISEHTVEAIPAYSEYVPVKGRKATATTPAVPDLDDADPDELITPASVSSMKTRARRCCSDSRRATRTTSSGWCAPCSCRWATAGTAG